MGLPMATSARDEGVTVRRRSAVLRSLSTDALVKANPRTRGEVVTLAKATGMMELGGGEEG